MASARDVLILGGGVIGLTTAYYLARAGVRVQLLDQSDFGQEASWAGAGILPPGNPACARTPFDQLRAHSVTMLRKLSEELKSLTGIDNGYLASGGLEFLGHHADAAAEEWRGEGIEAQRLTAKELQVLEPAVAPDLGSALLIPGMSQLRNPWHMRALIAACRSLGVALSPHQRVHALVRQGDRINAVRTAAGDVPVSQVVVAAGAWTDQLLAEIGCRLGITPVRGQIVLLHGDKPTLRHILLAGARYLVPRGDGRILAGSTEEHAGFDKRNTAAGVQGLLELATRLVPALAEAPVEKCWAGLRPGSRDGLPFIGRVPSCPNVIVAAGHFRAGIQLSAGTALLVKEMILGETPSVPLDAFRVDR
jgi:glycine oxidase